MDKRKEVALVNIATLTGVFGVALTICYGQGVRDGKALAANKSVVIPDEQSQPTPGFVPDEDCGCGEVAESPTPTDPGGSGEEG